MILNDKKLVKELLNDFGKTVNNIRPLLCSGKMYSFDFQNNNIINPCVDSNNTVIPFHAFDINNVFSDISIKNEYFVGILGYKFVTGYWDFTCNFNFHQRIKSNGEFGTSYFIDVKNNFNDSANVINLEGLKMFNSFQTPIFKYLTLDLADQNGNEADIPMELFFEGWRFNVE